MLTTQPYLIAGTLVLAYLLFTLCCYRQPIKNWRQRHTTTADLKQAQTLVAFASESGQSQTLAKALARQIQAPCLTLNQLTAEHLTSTQRLFIIASTTGEGDAPDNGRLFSAHLKNNELNHLSFAVLALGDSEYSYYCAFGLRVQQQLIQAGATPFFDAVTVDDMNPAALEKWQAHLADQGFAINSTDVASAEIQSQQSQLSLIFKNRQWLNPGSPGAGIYQIELAFADEIPHWQAGDIVELFITTENGGTIKREYTIASVPAENCLQLLVREQHYPDGKAGIGSGWLCHSAESGDSINASIRSNPNFHAPELSQPLILIGNGTGLAGLRAHLKQREINAADGAAQGDNWLIFGERSPTHDRPWHTELKRWNYGRLLQQIDFAFSRYTSDEFYSTETPPAKFSHSGYVQQILQSKATQLQEWLGHGACIYVCGSREGMAKGVDDTLREILGEQQLEELVLNGRYRRDVY